MAPLPAHQPKNLSLGPLEAEILNLVWELGQATVKDIHTRLLADPDRELAYTSVTTVLRRLAAKGWLICNKTERAFVWQPRLSRAEAQVLQAHERLQGFLAISNPDVVAAFADSLDRASLSQIEAIAERLRQTREQCRPPEEPPCI
ncbi:MAG: BlaI/MecI/CopY family transcriptional regulator [Spirulinaceae cyanobacterium RM2_2_10]|nr:BlaI/MecI/CopY family transcriptional regulator [Spirulinaceae cyanobacterium SM2_1_0]NJO19175.1 BlaI/MecI/CopY family transcriptional regulator [Spirulinaceae cyanobacterium RM2_2_10]